MISVCIATYNGEKYIYAQLCSILKQLNSDDEIIISDDSSTDKTIEIIKSFNDNRIKIFSGQNFASPIYNFENALNQAKGDIIFLSDQDDIWDDKKVVKVLEALKHADVVVSDCQIINDHEDTIVASYFAVRGSGPGMLRNLMKNSYLGCCMAFKRTILTKALPFPKSIPMHDIWLGFVSELFFKPVFLNESLTYYRKHDNNVSNTSSGRSQYHILDKIKLRFNIIKYLPLLLFR